MNIYTQFNVKITNFLVRILVFSFQVLCKISFEILTVFILQNICNHIT